MLCHDYLNSTKKKDPHQLTFKKTAILQKGEHLRSLYRDNGYYQPENPTTPKTV